MRRIKYKAASALFAVVILFVAVPAYGERKTVSRIDTDEKIVALTFDDGPHPRTTAERHFFQRGGERLEKT